MSRRLPNLPGRRLGMRNHPLRLIVALAVGLLAMTAGAPATLASDRAPSRSLVVDWHGFHFDGTNNRINPYETILGSGNVSQLTNRWTATTTGTIESSPAVVDGVVYVGTGTGLAAIDAATGTELWSATTAKAVRTAPEVSHGMVYVGDYGSRVYAFDAATAALRWMFVSRGSGVATPAVANGVVYVQGAKYLYALDADSGHQLWRFTTGATSAYFAATTVSRGVVYASGNSTLYALDAATGKLLWSKFAAETYYAATVVDGVVYSGSGNNGLFALDARTGAQRWVYPTANEYTAPAVVSGVVYVQEVGGGVSAIDASTGSLRWHSDNGDTLASVAVANGVLYTRDDAGVMALDTVDGTELWSAPIPMSGADASSSPTVVNGAVYVGSGQNTTGQLYAFALPSH
jgi:outer membrane protein assembly factor BamB